MKLLIDELAQTELFLGSPREPLERLAEHTQPLSLVPGELLLTPERENQHIYLLLEGTLTIHFKTPNSKAIRDLKVGQSAGEMSIIDDAKPSAYVKAQGPCRVFPVHRDFLMNLIKDTHPVAYNLLRSLTRLMKGNTQIIIEDQFQISALTTQANVDALTGLYNRRWLDNALPRLLNQMIKSDQPLTVLMIDVDHFKNYNDTQGHPGGDIALMAMGRILKSSVRPYDFVARYGGEEFIVLLPNTPLDDGVNFAERIRRETAKHRIESAGGARMPGITVSIGLAASDAASSMQSLVAEADTQLYRAKADGRNCVRHAGVQPATATLAAT